MVEQHLINVISDLFLSYHSSDPSFQVLQGAKYCEMKCKGALDLNPLLYHCTGESYEELLPYEWYEKAFPKLTRLAYFLKDVDFVDGRLSIVINDCIEQNEYIQVTCEDLYWVTISSANAKETCLYI
ncbi:hypothetical protein CRYUN_Cryun03dG0084700 [Craigia yunnanensis]